MATPIPTNRASFTVWELASVTGGDLTSVPDEHAVVAGLVTDSRAVVPGSAFVAIRGQHVDGHAYLESAVLHGAAAVIVESGASVPAGVASVVVDSTLVALGRLARAHIRGWRGGRSGARVVAITGSAGKTTTKELVAAILGAIGPTHFTTGNLNNRIGLPAVALGLSNHDFAVFELGMSMPGEIATLAEIVVPDVAVLLNVGLAHAAEFGGSRARIAREKGSIFEALSGHGIAVVNADDPAADAQLMRSSARSVRFGAAARSDVRLASRDTLATGASRIVVDRGGETFEVVLPIPGEAAALDLVAAIATADAAAEKHIPSAVIANAIAAWEPPPGRAQTYTLAGDITIIDDSYNANPASMRAAFSSLAELQRLKGGRAICVLGEMRELGSISTEAHQALGDELARYSFDLVVGSGGEIDLTLRRAEQRGVSARSTKHADEAGALLLSLVRAGDIILFKGSRGAAVERALTPLLARHPRLPPGADTPRGMT